MSQSRVSLSQIEGGNTIKEMLAWYRRIKESGFAQEFDAAWKETRKAATKAGYGPEDMDRLIAEVRKGNGRT